MELIGRLHPLLVHLPIGILVIGILLHLWSRFESGKMFLPALRPIYFFGALSALLSVATGLVLAGRGDYDPEYLNPHRNAGIILAITAVLLWAGTRWKFKGGNSVYVALLGMIMLIYTGHQGASLTHGSGFLFGSEQEVVEFKPIENVQEAIVYADVINPILHKKCVSCHGADKQKGKLRLDTEEFIRKGGKNGGVIDGKNEAEMLKRILLPPDDEDHMPPKEKGQLSKAQISLIRWWIENGANFQAKVKDVPQDDEIKASLAALESGDETEQMIQAEVLPEVEAAAPNVLDSLEKSGVVIVPVANGSNLLHINLINISGEAPVNWMDLEKLSQQAWTLKADNKLINNTALGTIGKLTRLRKLSLAGAAINDSGLVHLKGLKELQSLNLSGTGVTERGLEQLNTLKTLKALYIFDTAVDSTKIASIKDKFKGIQVEAGRYQVPILASDTTRLK